MFGRWFWSGRRDSNPRPRPWQGRATWILTTSSASIFQALIAHSSYWLWHTTIGILSLDIPVHGLWRDCGWTFRIPECAVASIKCYEVNGFIVRFLLGSKS